MQYIDFSSKKVRTQLLASAFVVTFFLMVAFMHGLYTRHLMKLPNYSLLQHSRSLAPEDVQGWMTFEYLNFVFKLPPDYLRQTLSIENARYPRVTLKRYADRAGIDLSLLIHNTREAIQNYRP